MARIRLKARTRQAINDPTKGFQKLRVGLLRKRQPGMVTATFLNLLTKTPRTIRVARGTVCVTAWPKYPRAERVR